MSAGAGFLILTVCSGNVCRSPLVELLLHDRLSSQPAIAVASAGTIARPGQRMTVEMVGVAARYGVSVETAAAHPAARLTEADVARADLVLGLAREHRADALRLHPAATKRTFTLNEFARLVGGVEAAGGVPVASAELVAEAASRRGARSPESAVADDIDDPIGLSQETYDRVGAEIAAAVDTIARALLLTRPDGSRPAAPAPAARDEPRLKFSFRRR